MDQVFDNYISTPQQKCVFDALRQEDNRDAYGVHEARQMLETAYAWLERRLQGRTWAAGDSFSLADCAAAPFLRPRGGRSAALQGVLPAGGAGSGLIGSLP